WNQVLSSSGFMAAALLDNDVTFTASIMRNGARTYVILIFEKVEENLARAAFESHYHASKGDQIFLGFSDRDPASFVATEVSNNAKAGMISAKLNMSAVWAAEVSDQELAALRGALTTKRVDAIRIVSSAGQ